MAQFWLIAILNRILNPNEGNYYKIIIFSIAIKFQSN
jgi:hypothetical protein